MSIERLSKCAGFLLAAFILFGVSPAWAGFQWVPPAPEQQAPPAPPAPQLSPAPAPELLSTAPAVAPSPSTSPSPLIIDQAPPQPSPATKNPEVITPIIIEGTPMTAQDSAQAAANEMPAAPPVLTPVTSPAPAAAPSADIVQGFANQVPLTVALRELLPPGYGFSIDQDVDMGVLVSFQGGKPWRETLAAALDPVGLVMHEQGQMISISRIPAQATFTQTPSAPAPTPVTTPTPAPTILSTSAAATSTPPAPAAAAPTPSAQPAPVPAPIIITSSAPSTPAASANPPLPSSTLAMTPSPPVKASPVAPVPVSTVEVWSAERGDSLRKVLEDWSHRVHAEVEWLAEYDYPLQASINYSGTYEEAVRNLLMGFEGAHPEPVAQLHINPELGQTVLVVRTRGNTSRD